jgi:hypothetical protein
LVTIGHWFANGALFVLPACGVLLGATAVIRRDFRMLRLLAFGALVFMVSFGVHYQYGLRYARESRYFREFWAFALPPPTASFWESTAWVWGQLQPLAFKPGGTERWTLFWSVAAAGFVFSRPRFLGIAALSVVFTGFLLAGLRVVPMYQRLSLWFLPAVYLGIALAADKTPALAAQSRPHRYAWFGRSAALVMILVSCLVSLDIAANGVRAAQIGASAEFNRAIDDRSGMSWLMSQRHPGDAVITTRFGLPAVWWYGNVSLAPGNNGTRYPDGGQIFVAEHRPYGEECRDKDFRHTVGEGRRVLVYLGFEDTPAGFADLLLDSVSGFGAVTLKHFGNLSRGAVVDPSIRGALNPFWNDAGKRGSLGGCVAFRAASSW